MKRWWVVPVAGAMLVTAGCGASSGSGSSAASKNFYIASPIDRTGADAAIGTFWAAGLNAAVKAVNAQGGILGRKVVVTYQDTQSNPQTASQVTNEMLASGKYQAMVPTSSGSMSQPELQAANRYRVLTVGTGPLLSMNDPKQYPYAFDVKFDAASQGQAVGCLAASFHPKRVAFLHIDDPFPTAQIAAMTPILQAAGAQIVANESYPIDATDVTAQVQQIKNAKPDVLVLFAYFNSLSAAITAIDSLNLNVQVVGDAEVSASPPSSFLAKGTALPSKIVAMQWAINTRVNGVLSPEQKAGVAAVSPAIDGKFNAVLATYLYTYDALKLIKWAAEKAKSDSTPAMVKELETLGTGGNPGTFVTPRPPYSPTFHGNRGQMYSVNLSGPYIDGTFQEIAPIPNCAS